MVHKMQNAFMSSMRKCLVYRIIPHSAQTHVSSVHDHYGISYGAVAASLESFTKLSFWCNLKTVTSLMTSPSFGVIRDDELDAVDQGN